MQLRLQAQKQIVHTTIYATRKANTYVESNPEIGEEKNNVVNVYAFSCIYCFIPYLFVESKARCKKYGDCSSMQIISGTFERLAKELTNLKTVDFRGCTKDVGKYVQVRFCFVHTLYDFR